MEVRGGSVEASKEVRGGLNGGLHGASMELYGDLH